MGTIGSYTKVSNAIRAKQNLYIARWKILNQYRDVTEIKELDFSQFCFFFLMILLWNGKTTQDTILNCAMCNEHETY